ncbi:MAG: putative quinol monooxygenase [Acidimicrobiales bacterium]
MSKISLIAKLTAAEGKADELKAALSAMIVAAEEEAGLEVYSVHADNEDANVFYFFELYTDQAALDVHGKGDGMKAAMGALKGLLGGRPDVTMLTPVAAKGLSL